MIGIFNNAFSFNQILGWSEAACTSSARVEGTASCAPGPRGPPSFRRCDVSAHLDGAFANSGCEATSCGVTAAPCSRCPPGYATRVGKSAADVFECDQCAAGYVRNDGATCQPCADNTWSPVRKSTFRGHFSLESKRHLSTIFPRHASRDSPRLLSRPLLSGIG